MQQFDVSSVQQFGLRWNTVFFQLPIRIPGRKLTGSRRNLKRTSNPHGNLLLACEASVLYIPAPDHCEGKITQHLQYNCVLLVRTGLFSNW